MKSVIFVLFAQASLVFPSTNFSTVESPHPSRNIFVSACITFWFGLYPFRFLVAAIFWVKRKKLKPQSQSAFGSNYLHRLSLFRFKKCQKNSQEGSKCVLKNFTRKCSKPCNAIKHSHRDLPYPTV